MKPYQQSDGMSLAEEQECLLLLAPIVVAQVPSAILDSESTIK